MNPPHLDDESLSAALDGQDEGAAGHLAGCAECRVRSDALAAVARAVAADAAPAPAGTSERAVAAALAAYDADRAVGRASAGAGAGHTGPRGERPGAVPLRPAGEPASGPAHVPSDRRRRLPAWALGVAAALAAVLVAVPVLSRLKDSTGGGTAATSMASPQSRLAEGAAGTRGTDVVEGGDLGDQTDQLALGSLVAGALGEAPPPTVATTTAPSGADGKATAGSAGPSVAAAAPAPAAADASSAAPTTTTPPSATAAAGQYAQSIAPPADPTAVTACEQQAASQFGGRLGTLVYRATLRWKGTPAVVLAYKLSGATGALDHRAVVMALDGCEILVSQGF